METLTKTYVDMAWFIPFQIALAEIFLISIINFLLSHYSGEFISSFQDIDSPYIYLLHNEMYM